MDILPFYGTDHPDPFAIEPAAMDRDERVVERLDELLPGGSVAEIAPGMSVTSIVERHAGVRSEGHWRPGDSR